MSVIQCIVQCVSVDCSTYQSTINHAPKVSCHAIRGTIFHALNGSYHSMYHALGIYRLHAQRGPYHALKVSKVPYYRLISCFHRSLLATYHALRGPGSYHALLEDTTIFSESPAVLSEGPIMLSRCNQANSFNMFPRVLPCSQRVLLSCFQGSLIMISESPTMLSELAARGLYHALRVSYYFVKVAWYSMKKRWPVQGPTC